MTLFVSIRTIEAVACSWISAAFFARSSKEVPHIVLFRGFNQTFSSTDLFGQASELSWSDPVLSDVTVVSLLFFF
jgi:hypothetical protein